MAQLGGQPQLDLQMAIVKALKDNGANTVGIDLKNYLPKQLSNILVRKKNNLRPLRGTLSKRQWQNL